MEKKSIFLTLAEIMEDRKTKLPETSYVATLFHKGIAKINAKIEEEALEVIEAEKENDRDHLIYEIADLFFHTLILASFCNINFNTDTKHIQMHENRKIKNPNDELSEEVRRLISANEVTEEKISNVLSTALLVGKKYRITIKDIEDELTRREGVSGHVEKSSRNK